MSDDWRALARKYARKYGISNPYAFQRQMGQEAHGEDLTSPKGAQGPAQIMPATAAAWGVKNPHDINQAYDAAAKHMAGYEKEYGSLRDALVAYNAGPGRVGQSLPAQTSNYIKTILGNHGSSRAPTSSIVQRIASQSSSVPGSTPASPPQPSVYDVVRQYRDATQPETGQPGAYGQVPFDSQASATKIQDTVAQIIARRNLTAQPAQGTPPVASAAMTDVMPKGKQKGFKGGDPVVGGTSVGGEHETAGLAGYPAKDYFAPAGSTAVAPVSGKVIKLSGHNPKNGPTNGPHGPLGYSVYIQAADGRTYFLTHLGKRSVKVGQTIKAGTPIGTVANYDKYGTPSHIHMGVH